MPAKIITIDLYISGFPADVQEILQKIRRLIAATVPEAREAICYQIPTFVLHGNLIHFAAFKAHIGLYPTPSGIAAFADELAPYKHARGSVQFPFASPIPYALIERIVRFRVDEQQQSVAGTPKPAPRQKATAADSSKGRPNPLS